MKKRFLSCLMALALCLTLLPAAALAAGEHKHCLCGTRGCDGAVHGTASTMTTFDQWLGSKLENGTPQLLVGGPSNASGTELTPQNSKLVLQDGSYYLKTKSDDSSLERTVTIEYPIVIKGNVTICLNGKTIQSEGKDMPVFQIENGGTLTLTDCKGDFGKVTHSGANAAPNKSINTGVNVYKGGTFNLYGGSISGNNSTRYGGVYVGGTFKMYGGSITGNTANAGGGGVYVDSRGTFNMNGGTISGNEVNIDDGGGVKVYTFGEFTMTSGSITGNKAAGDGGGVCVSGGTFNMEGGSITGNEAIGGNSNGGGVYAGGKFNMSGGTIGGAQKGEANKAKNGGGVWVRSTFTMSGSASIIKNEASESGGGVCVTDSFGELNMSDSTKITGNTAAQQGGGVYVDSGSKKFTVSGGAAVMENKNKSGADNNVYLPDSKTITIGESGLSGSIGVTTANAPAEGGTIQIATGAKDGDEKHFASDAGYQITYDNDKLVLAEKSGGTTQPTTPTGHTHFLCTTGDNCTTVGGHDCKKKTEFTAWNITNELPTDKGNWYLTENVTLSSTWTPALGTVLCLNGHSITANGNFNTIKVNGGTFTLTDCQSNQGSVTHGSGAYGRGVEVEDGTFNLYKGSITGNKGEYINREPPRGGGVMMNNKSAFNMYGGKISGNTGTLCDGGVNVAYSSSIFNLYDGEISNNNGISGGVYVDGKFNMSGGKIKDNRATISGGVDVRGGAAFNMSGGSITNNTATYSGGVYVYDGATFTVSGSANITGNKKGETDNNVYLSKTDSTIIGVTGALTGGARIGVTTETWPGGSGQVAIASGESAATGGTHYDMTHDDMKCFQSDNGEYQTSLENNTVLLAKMGGGTPPPTHEHTYGAWSKDATHHWHECTDDKCPDKPGSIKDKAAHVYTGDADTTCNVCGYIRTVTPSQPGGGSTGGTTGSGSSSGGSSGSSSSGGGSSSSDRDSYDSNPIIKTETKNNADGSTTKTETRKDGSVTQTTTAKDGSTSKTETKKDGSSVTENKAADGSTGTVKTGKNGQTEANAKVSAKAVEDAKKSGEPVKAPVEVKAARNSNAAPTVKVELPKNAGETEVEIPVSNAKPGTVAVLVHPDGTEEILKASVPTENGIRLTVDGNATVKIVDNSKDFVDTRNHWAREEIDFVSARELVNGISATRYAPDATATRAQLWTILARQNDTDLSGGANWYEKAQLWSKDKGISDGTNPNGTINRAQMVTMLWRTMGQPAAGGSASFADVPADSYYAQAVAWAIENGITAGVGGGRFDPNSTCTRAQIATFLARSMK